MTLNEHIQNTARRRAASPRGVSWGLMLLMTGMCWGQTSTTKVDLNVAGGRSQALKEGWYNQPCEAGKPVDVRLGAVELTLTGGGDAGIETVFYKGLLDFGAAMAADGITVEDGEDGSIEIRITGLSPGQHSLATYHNEVRNVTPRVFDVCLADRVVAANVVPTRRAEHDDDVTAAYTVFEAGFGEPVVLRLVPKDRAIVGAGIVINGFELDRPDPHRRAKKPSPADGEQHAAADLGLAWTAGPSAVSHRVYFGADSNAIANATPASPEFKGDSTASSFPATRLGKLDHFHEYFWRVDSVDADAGVTRGDVWRFSVRHPAFPSAEGYGRFAKGGRGGRVIKVTNLNDAGPGSLRAAVEAEGPRTVVFDVSGLITLESRLVIRNPYLTLAGQTAPGIGICIRKYNLGMLGTHDVIVRYLRVRPGNLSGQTLDGMGMASSDQSIIDHCSISWTLDESFSSRGAKNITLQRTFISEALNEAGHSHYPPGTQHGYAASIGGRVGSFHHNLLAHCSGRNWSLAGGINNRNQHTGWLDLRNNVVYNWQNRTTDGGAEKVNFVSNYYKPGPASRLFTELNPQFENPAFGPQLYYVEGNVMEGRHGPEGPLGPFEGVRPRPRTPWQEFTVPTPFFEPHVHTHSAQEAYSNVLADVGCNFPALDEHDRRVIREVREGTAAFRGSRTDLPGLPDSQDDVGGWEDYPQEKRPANWDADNDGIPDAWEQERGLDPDDPSDGNGDRDDDGYTNLEEYLGWLVGEF